MRTVLGSREGIPKIEANAAYSLAETTPAQSRFGRARYFAKRTGGGVKKRKPQQDVSGADDPHLNSHGPVGAAYSGYVEETTKYFLPSHMTGTARTMQKIAVA